MARFTACMAQARWKKSIPRLRQMAPPGMLPGLARPASHYLAQSRYTLQDLRGELGIKNDKLEKVNVAARVEELGLHNFYDSDSWPNAAPLRELRTKIRNLTGEGFANPFVFADLKK